jgi:enhancer of polycomb-like protein
MTAEDDEFLKSYNSNPPAAGTLSEDDFERIMEVFEDTATEQTPFAAVDNTVVGYDMMVLGLNQLGSATILQHAKQIYEYWKSKRQEEGNKPLPATIKYETHQETDDTDPYVCFRRREVRQTRKTRSRDTKIAETLKRFRRELEDGRQLVLMAYEREMMKRDLLQVDRAIFEERARLKQIKTKLGIKGDDEDLVNQKVCFKSRPAWLSICIMPLDTNTMGNHSLRSASLQKLPELSGQPHKCGYRCGRMDAHTSKTLCCFLTSSPRKKMSFVVRSRPRCKITGGGTRITLISLETRCLR